MSTLSLSVSLGFLEIISMASQLWEDYLALPYHFMNHVKHLTNVDLNLLLGHDTFKKSYFQ